MGTEPWMVKAWLAEFLKEMQTTFPETTWSDDDREWTGWLHALIEVRALREEAELAASRLEGREANHPDQIRDWIVQEVINLRRKPDPFTSTTDRDSARAASRDCPHCDGSGFTMVADPRAGQICAHCICPMGRWARSKTGNENLRGIPDFAEILAQRKRPRIERFAEAGEAYDAFRDLGWEFRWYETENQFRAHRTVEGAPRPSLELSNRLRAYRSEIYALLAHPIEEEVLDAEEFRDAGGKLDWRRMATALAEQLTEEVTRV